ncbi:hypothetical protein OPT61_g7769 [Boeremia exigua]|uniref:Uncharacterized protein n=1 Tax=Boeremia exigua TaxID=749465 RepID=A0ACC2I1L6_9PLEO|nr:hypothetical protein OPT61_g7769 [Boeremia exigua]
MEKAKRQARSVDRWLGGKLLRDSNRRDSESAPVPSYIWKWLIDFTELSGLNRPSLVQHRRTCPHLPAGSSFTFTFEQVIGLCVTLARWKILPANAPCYLRPAPACVAPVTVTVTETVCGTPGVPIHTPPVASSYEAPPPPSDVSATSVESTATPPLSSPAVDTATVVPPAPPAETVVPPAPPAETGVPPAVPSGVAPTSRASSSGVAPSTGINTSASSVPGTTTVRPTATPPSSSASPPAEVSDAAAILAVPASYFGLGSLFVAGAAAMAVVA